MSSYEVSSETGHRRSRSKEGRPKRSRSTSRRASRDADLKVPMDVHSMRTDVRGVPDYTRPTAHSGIIDGHETWRLLEFEKNFRSTTPSACLQSKFFPNKACDGNTPCPPRVHVPVSKLKDRGRLSHQRQTFQGGIQRSSVHGASPPAQVQARGASPPRDVWITPRVIQHPVIFPNISPDGQEIIDDVAKASHRRHQASPLAGSNGTMLMDKKFIENQTARKYETQTPQDIEREVERIAPLIMAARLSPVDHATTCFIGTSKFIPARHMADICDPSNASTNRTMSKGFRDGQLADDSFRITLRRHKHGKNMLETDLHCNGNVFDHLNDLKVGTMIVDVTLCNLNTTDRFLIHRGQIIKVTTGTVIDGEKLMALHDDDQYLVFSCLLFCAKLKQK